MEQHIVSLNKGIHRTPSTGESGELSECVGLVVRDGELRNAPVSVKCGEMASGETLLFEHKVSNLEEVVVNRVYLNQLQLKYRKENENISVTHEIVTFESGEVIKDVKAIGNVLVVNTSKMLRMYLWDDGYEIYTFGNVRPLDFRFALKGYFQRTSGSGVNVVKSESIVMENDMLIKSTISKVKAYESVTYYFPQKRDEHIKFSTPLQAGETYVVKFVQTNSSDPYNIIKPSSGWADILGLSYYGIPQGAYGLFDTEDEIDESQEYKFTQAKQIGFISDSVLTQFSFTVNAGFTVKRIAISVYAKEPYQIEVYKKAKETLETEFSVNTNSEDNINAVLATANRFINEKATKANRFIFPFFVRTAVKMIDGTYILPSAPTLMVPSDGVEPKISIDLGDTSTEDISSKTGTVASGVVCDLYYKLLDEETLSLLKSMSSFIQSVDIGISEPLRRYKQSPTTDESKQYMVINNYTSSKGYYMSDVFTDGDVCKERSRKDVEEKTSDTLYSNHEIGLPENKDIGEEIEKINSFYVIKSISINELCTNESYTMVEMTDGVLSNLITRDRLSDNTLSLQTLSSEIIFSYNNRLVLANYKQVPFDGYSPMLMNGIDYGDGGRTIVTVYSRTTLNISGRIVRTKIQKCDLDGYGGLLWVYYPNSKAVSMELFIHSTPKYSDFSSTPYYAKCTIELKEHPLLKGAYMFHDFQKILSKYEYIKKTEWDSIMSEEDDSDIIIMENGIMQSMVNNPFEFDDALTSTVGRGEIKALSTTTKALSEGQFGSFPLITFGEEGIWAISVSGEGKFQGVQPISRDCILDGVQPLQIDNAIVFPTSGGLNVLSGSSVSDISDNFEGMNEDVTIAKGIMVTHDTLIANETNGFNMSLEDAEMSWDSDNKLIHVWTSDAHYVCDLKTKEWTKSAEAKPDRIIHGYPHTTLQFGTELKEYKRTNDSTTKRKGFLMTREMAFGAPMSMKVVDQLKMYTKLQSADSSIMVAAFVSNDRMTWHRLKSLKTSSWKWYKFAIYTDMTDVESVCGIVLTAEERRTGRLR